MQDIIRNLFTESIQTKIEAADTLSADIEKGIQLMLNALINGGKIFTCGIGGSALNAQHLSSQLIHRFERERPALPAICLADNNSTFTAIAKDGDYDNVFSNPIRALGQAKDILVVYTCKGNAPSIIKAMEAALSRDMLVVALSGSDGGQVAGFIGANDVEIRVPSSSRARIYEVHMLITHCFCNLIDRGLFGE